MEDRGASSDVPGEEREGGEGRKERERREERERRVPDTHIDPREPVAQDREEVRLLLKIKHRVVSVDLRCDEAP